MTTTIDRRAFLTSAVLGGVGIAGATGLGSLAPEAAFAGVPDLPGDAVDPNFAEGRIVGITGTMLLVSGSSGGAAGVLHRIRVTGGTSIWKVRPTTFDQVAVGDGLYARGVRLDDGVLAADAVWVNIVSLHVELAGVSRTKLVMDHHGHALVGHLIPGTTAAVFQDAPATADLSGLRVGKHVQIIGAWRPDTDEIDVCTIYT